MPKVFIENKAYDVKEGENLLQATLSLGIDVPYFCWHPALGSVGACRQCAVQQFKDETDTKGKLIMSCMTQVSEGMRVSVNHEASKEFRSSVIEWMMTNHPHDCPVCDEGGECHLQDMTVMTGHNYRKFRYKKRTFRNQNLGPFISHEMNRCITCYRCVRFYKDVAGGDDLGAFASSNRVYFGRAEEGTLENEFSGNLVEICPTGVFTDKQFKSRFIRKWDLQTAPSVCQLCSLGCNTIPGERYGKFRRIQSRYNPNVNGYFLCDRGRFGHDFVNSDKRLKSAKGISQEAFTQQLLEKKTVIGIGSARASLESNFSLRSLVGKENFYAALTSTEINCMQAVVEAYKVMGTNIASQRDVEHADAIVVLGEDVTNTAPMLALAIRKSVFRKRQAEATKIGVQAWHDLAVRNFSREVDSGVFVASPFATKLDDIAQEKIHLAMPAAAGIQQLTPELDASLRWHDKLVDAQNIVVITGTSLQSPQIIESAVQLVQSLQKLGKSAKLCCALSECNSMGLAVMNAKSIDELVGRVQRKDIDAAVVVEVDIASKLSKHDFQSFCSSVSQIVVLDSFEHASTEKAHGVVPVATFFEGTGTLVNNEARAQRFYKVFNNAELKESWHVINDWLALVHPEKCSKNLDEMTKKMADEIEALKPMLSNTYLANFRMLGQKIPRETLEYSGRTAMNAHKSMHEPAPPVDLDSPLAHSMEGFNGMPPADLTSFFWSPGWNSIQSLNKYQQEVGGDYRSEHAGVRLFDGYESNFPLPRAGEGLRVRVPKVSLPDSPSSLVLLPQAGEGNKAYKQLTIIPRDHIFGGEEREQWSAAMRERMDEVMIGLSTHDAAHHKIVHGGKVSVLIGEHELFLPVQIIAELEPGYATLPVRRLAAQYGRLADTCMVGSVLA